MSGRALPRISIPERPHLIPDLLDFSQGGIGAHLTNTLELVEQRTFLIRPPAGRCAQLPQIASVAVERLLCCVAEHHRRPRRWNWSR